MAECAQSSWGCRRAGHLAPRLTDESRGAMLVNLHYQIKKHMENLRFDLHVDQPTPLFLIASTNLHFNKTCLSSALMTNFQLEEQPAGVRYFFCSPEGRNIINLLLCSA